MLTYMQANKKTIELNQWPFARWRLVTNPMFNAMTSHGQDMINHLTNLVLFSQSKQKIKTHFFGRVSH
jgi:hypothetical protein